MRVKEVTHLLIFQSFAKLCYLYRVLLCSCEVSGPICVVGGPILRPFDCIENAASSSSFACVSSWNNFANYLHCGIVKPRMTIIGQPSSAVPSLLSSLSTIFMPELSFCICVLLPLPGRDFHTCRSWLLLCFGSGAKQPFVKTMFTRMLPMLISYMYRLAGSCYYAI